MIFKTCQTLYRISETAFPYCLTVGAIGGGVWASQTKDVPIYAGAWYGALAGAAVATLPVVVPAAVVMTKVLDWHMDRSFRQKRALERAKEMYNP